MQRTQNYLSNSEKQGLQAIDSFLERHQPVGRLARLRQARGLWAAREDLPSWPALRSELNREAPLVT
jgi:hypothetical protein